MLYGAHSEERSIFVCPSISFPSDELRKIAAIQHYEERLLFMLLALSDPAISIAYASSLPIDEAIVDYYLGFTPDPGGARARLELMTLDDPRPLALTPKILNRPDIMDRAARFLGGKEAGCILPFNVTSWEGALAARLGAPLYGPPPHLAPLGSKSGARRLARAAGVSVLDGAEDLWSMDAVESAIAALLRRRPDAGAVVVKLNNGFSGQGNAILETRRIQRPLEATDAIFCAPEESWSSFARKISLGGAVIEELVRAPGAVSPSVQLHVDADGACEIISTHDQILGGPDDQVYLGCRFPARKDYRDRIQELGLRIGRALANEGVVGPFGVDFLAVPGTAGYEVSLSEINLRMGGTTHPFAMALMASGGAYDARDGELVAGGRRKAYVATDNLKSPAYLRLAPSDVIDAIQRRGLAFHAPGGTGATLHLLGALPRFGKMGVTCIADTHEDANDLLGAVTAALGGAATS